MGRKGRSKIRGEQYAVYILIPISIAIVIYMLVFGNFGVAGVDWHAMALTIAGGFAYIFMYGVIFYSISYLPNKRRAGPIAYPIVFFLLSIVSVGFLGFLDSNGIIVLANVTSNIAGLNAGVVLLCLIIGVISMVINR